jgi:hypothetical protein
MEKEIIIITVALLLGFYNGQFIMNQTKNWHITGFIIRALLVIPLYPNTLAVLIYINCAWLLYDIIINLYMKQKWYYQGRTAWMDKNIPSGITWGLKFTFFIILVAEITKLI